MTAPRLLLVLAGAFALSGCADMMTVTPQLEMKSGSAQKMEVKATVMAVGTLDYSPDGKQLASAGVAPMVKIWDMTTAKGLRTLPIPATYGVVDVAYSPNGKLLAASGATGLFGGSITYLWDAETGKQIKTVPGNLSYKLAFSVDNKYLLGSEFNAGGLFDAPTWNAKQFDLASDAVVRSFPGLTVGAMSPDGRSVLLKGDNRKGLALVDLVSGREIWRSGDRWTDAVALTPDRRHVLASHSEFHGVLGTRATMSLALLDAATGNQIRDLVRYDVENT